MRFRTLLIIAAIVIQSNPAISETVRELMRKRGSIEFWFQLPQEYRNGLDPQGELIKLLEIPGMALVKVDSPSSEAAVNVASYTGKTAEAADGERKPPSSIVTFEWSWTTPPLAGGIVTEGNRLWLDAPILPGPAWYHAAFSWDSEKGAFDGYINGFPLRIPGGVSSPWNVVEGETEFILASGVEGFSISSEFWTQDEVRGKARKRSTVDIGPIVGFASKAPLSEISKLKGNLLYSPDFSRPSGLYGWSMDGPGLIETDANGWLTLESSEANAPGAATGHIVYWAPVVFPSDFIAEWDFRAIRVWPLHNLFCRQRSQWRTSFRSQTGKTNRQFSPVHYG